MTANAMTGIKEINLPEYARLFAEAGFATITFDYRYWGESSGEPRYHLAPMEHRTDISSALMFLSDQPEMDPDLDKAVHEMMQPDTVLLGGVTYQLFDSYWPNVMRDPNASKEERILANELNQMTKVVFSKTLKKVTWENSKLFEDNLVEEVRKLKQEKGSDIVIFGSGTIVQQLTSEGLIDEYLIIVTPVILGNGKLLFKGNYSAY